MPIVASIFDAFGTTVQIVRKYHPFRQLLRIGAEQGRKASTADLRTLMTASLSLEQAAERFGIQASPEQMLALQRDLEDELASITVYPDALDAIRLLRSEGIRIGICSNLAQPYGAVIRNLLQEVDGFALSFELGVIKPDAGIYHDICHQLGVQPTWDMRSTSDRVVMIGDSLKCDQDGPRVIGISGYHLDRSGAGRITNLLQFAEALIKHRDHLTDE
ncbi:HAD-IA family hydrolase [Pseudomonas coleopterorum]|uniref:HAD family hydrolase n=1 Tax=Pseudomonas coleopterorum TaxID=1605838 RepID=UPI002A6ACDF0|nr:HAD-IA family hydrolase [Pseudomonas coleopterorum]MDY1046976.1 HAD-IA family hydrolase [Pseudomonas coleopterorum]